MQPHTVSCRYPHARRLGACALVLLTLACVRANPAGRPERSPIDSAAAVVLAKHALMRRNALVPADTVHVAAFERDSSGVVLSITRKPIPAGREYEQGILRQRFGGGGLVRVHNGGQVQVLKLYP